MARSFFVGVLFQVENATSERQAEFAVERITEQILGAGEHIVSFCRMLDGETYEEETP